MLGYIPDGKARALKTGRTDIISYYSGYGHVSVKTPYFTEVISGLQKGCERFQKDLLLHAAFHHQSGSEGKIAGQLLDGRIDGLVASLRPGDPLIELLNGRRIPLVALSDAIEGVASIVVDDAEGGRMIADHFADRGHRRCVFAANTYITASARLREEAFALRCSDRGLEVATIRADRDEWSPILKEEFSRGATAVFAWNDSLAQELLVKMRDLGLCHPQHGLAGFDGCPSASRPETPITSVVAPWEKAAELAVEMLDRLFHGKPCPPLTMLPVSLSVGATT